MRDDGSGEPIFGNRTRISADEFRAGMGIEPAEAAPPVVIGRAAERGSVPAIPASSAITPKPTPNAALKPPAKRVRAKQKIKPDLSLPLIDKLRLYVFGSAKNDGTPLEIGKLRYGPEDAISAEFRREIVAAKLMGRYVGAFTHVGNEGKRTGPVAHLLRWVGLMPGAPDWWFIWTCNDGSMGGALIEFKTKARESSLQPTQKIWRDWADEDGIPHAVCDSAEDAMEFLTEQGAFRW